MSFSDQNFSNEQPAPQPFTPQAPNDSTTGCGRVGLIGCGVLTLLLGAAAIVFLLKAEDLFGWAMENFQAQIMQSLPDDLDDEEAARLRHAFDAAVAAVKEGTVNPKALQQMQEELRNSMWEAGATLTREQVSRLTEALEAVAVASDVAPEIDSDPAADS
jgi:hypothetical protein